jgi:hypothetical protein
LIKAFFFAATCTALLPTVCPVHADDLVQQGDPGERNLASLSVQTPMSSSSDVSPALGQVPSQAPQQGPTSIFSDKQANLMRALSKTIDVIPGGVRLCLNIHY